MSPEAARQDLPHGVRSAPEPQVKTMDIMKILVIDDERSIRNSLKEILMDEG